MQPLRVLHSNSLRSSAPTDEPDRNYLVYSEARSFETELHPFLYSIKLSLRGCEKYWLPDRDYQLDPQHFLITNPAPHTYVRIDSEQSVQGLCIGFAPRFLQKLAAQMSTPLDAILEGRENRQQAIRFLEHPYAWEQNEGLSIFLQGLIRHWQADSIETTYNEDQFFWDLGESLLLQQQTVYQSLDRLEQRKKSTREELYRRVQQMEQLIQANYLEDLKIEDLARTACLSKYHAIRSYQKIKGQSPYQRILELRLAKARELVEAGLPLAEVAWQTRFSDRRALSRSVKKQFGHLPTAWRH